MKLYATSIPQSLPSWATVISNNAGLIEVEINYLKLVILKSLVQH